MAVSGTVPSVTPPCSGEKKKGPALGENMRINHWIGEETIGEYVEWNCSSDHSA